MLEGVIDVKYYTEENKFEIKSNLKKEGQYTIIETFLRGQIGAGIDESERNKKEVYTITLKWNPANDNITVFHDTGNKGLRDGLLYGALETLN